MYVIFLFFKECVDSAEPELHDSVSEISPSTPVFEAKEDSTNCDEAPHPPSMPSYDQQIVPSPSSTDTSQPLATNQPLSCSHSHQQSSQTLSKCTGQAHLADMCPTLHPEGLAEISEDTLCQYTYSIDIRSIQSVLLSEGLNCFLR